MLDAPEDPRLTCAERRTCLWVSLNERVVWGGIIWDTEPDIPGGQLRIAAQTWSSFFQRSLIRETLVYRTAPPGDPSDRGIEQFEIFRSLVAYAQGKTGANIGVVVDGHNSGLTLIRLYGPGAGDGARPDKPVGEAMRELAEDDPGFEFVDDWS